MDVIMLTGPGSCGKTRVLNVLYDNLTVNYGATVHIAKNQLGGNPDDFEAGFVSRRAVPEMRAAFKQQSSTPPF